MSGQGVTVKGLKETIRTLEKFGVAVGDMKAAFKRIGQNVADDAKTRTNARSGRLANSIKPSNTKNKSIIRAGSARVPYAGVINYGGYNGIAPKNYLNKAVAAKQDETVAALDEELGHLISKYGLKY